MSTNFPGDLTSGFSPAVPRVLAGRIFSGPIDGDGPWVELGMLREDGVVMHPAEEESMMSWGRNEPIRITGMSMHASIDIVDQIDRAVASLCPCGAEPSEEFAPYCGYDCKPNHHSEDTTSDFDGTRMWWRPDLVSAVDDTHLTSYLPRARHGQFYVEVFERAGTNLLHVRLDDDHRWVGADVPRDPAEDFAQRYEAKLRALVAELEDNRRTVPDVPAARPAAMMQEYVARVAQVAAAEMNLHRAYREWWMREAGIHQDITPQVANMHWVNPPRPANRLAEMGRALMARMRQFGQNVGQNMGQTQPRRPEGQREEVLRRVRAGRNAGPQGSERAPRRIDPRRSR